MALLDTLPNAQQVAALFIGYYDRAPAVNGYNKYLGDLDGGQTIAQVANSFVNQTETTDLYPTITQPTLSEADAIAFVNAVFVNVFGKLPSKEGLDNFWVKQILDEGTAPADALLGIMQGAKGDDAIVLQNKIDVSVAFVEAAVAAEDDGKGPLKDSILDDVDSTQASVTDAVAQIAAVFPPKVELADEISLTSGTDRGGEFDGTDGNDPFLAYLQQNPTAGGVSNSLSSADKLDGGAGEDSLYAELVSEFVGSNVGVENIDVQPRINNIETIEIEARDIASNAPANFDLQDLIANLGYSFNVAGFPGGIVTEENIAKVLDGWQRDVAVDAKNITGHDYLGSTFSDGDLMIENVNTIDSNGAVRNTSDITIGMDHTDNANSDGDASDLVVYFDEDYLIAGQDTESVVRYYLLDEKAELAGNPNRLAEINVDGLLLSLDGGATVIEISDPATLTAGTHQGFVDALQPALNQLIADGVLPAGTELTLGTAPVDTTGLDDGSLSGPIPPIELKIGDGSEVTDGGFAQVTDLLGDYDVYGVFEPNPPVTTAQPVSVNIDLYKAGRGGEGGNLVVGGKDQSDAGDGIEVFHINVKGDGSDAVVDQPSNVGTITSTNNALREVYIKTDASDADKSSVASLTVRDGFNELYDGDSASGLESGDLEKIDANLFRGNLTLGGNNFGLIPFGITGPVNADPTLPAPIVPIPFLAEGESIINADMVTAMGGGNVTFWGEYTGTEDGQDYQIMTGAGNDTFVLDIDGDAVDAVDESLSLNMGDGDNTALVAVNNSSFFNTSPDGSDDISGGNSFDANGVSQLTTGRLMNLDLVGGAGVDTVQVAGMGTWDIDVNGGSDTVWINAGGQAGAGNLWNPTGPSAFVPVAVYKAQLTISAAGFEETVSINTGDDFILTEAELNVALLAAIAKNSEIARLVEASVGTSNQDLIVRSLIDGTNEAGFQILQPQLIASPTVPAAGSSQMVLAESDVPKFIDALIDTGVIASSAGLTDAASVLAGGGAAFAADNGILQFGKTADDYAGTITTFIAPADQPAGTNGGTVNNSKINMGDGANDLVILSDNNTSVNTLVFSDANTGPTGASKTSVVNFFDQATTNALLTNGPGAQVNGIHLLDFTAFLTNRTTDTGSTQSSVYEGIEVIAPSTTTNVMQANSMHFLTVDQLEAALSTASGSAVNLSFDTINDAAVKGVIEDSTNAALDAIVTYNAEAVSNGSTAGLVQGTALRTSIIAIENVDVEGGTTVLDNSNVGEYKFFQVTYATTVEAANDIVSVTEIEVVDFGDSIDITPATLEANLVGTTTTNTDTTLVDSFLP